MGQSDTTSASLLPIKAGSAASRVILLRFLTKMKDGETFGYVVFSYRRPILTKFMDFFVQFRQLLNNLESSETVPIISWHRWDSCFRITTSWTYLISNDSSTWNRESLKTRPCKKRPKGGHRAFLQAIWTEYGKPKL
ncbi:hypothetical protein NPIL_304321 [Nephila pilipes]|uniref:Uncharacterized protein n=1 Tax=Nephila pilipes TaxID=299642 RepID=A0A8X6UDR2_NEPPI|nr:hypothetical protein NPIL_304321 [Nephila pilipes]